ncbi:FAD-dependent monooxygenase [Myxosarcina sp. GI1]|uniref:FAD-dependent monooxygenase n=1 Tax=Myxosarcina sp. GI1 TaxID=1541065 RepID=UPI00056C51D5|nr:FAD-dependent monooxygenase [Myxosarcina sp. GI1]
MVSSHCKIGIIGAGASGIYLAILLAQQGYQVDLFEKSSYPRTDGCGILLISQGLETLRQGNLQLCQQVMNSGVKVNKFEFRNFKDILVNSQSPQYSTEQLPSLLIHRKAILETLLEFLPPESLHLNAEFESIESTEERVTAYFKDGTQWQGDLLVGADGLFSQVRELVVPNIKPFYLGDIVWRGIVADDTFCTDGNFIVYVRSRGIYANFFDLGNGLTHWGFFIEREKDELERSLNIPLPSEELAKLPSEARSVIESTPPEQIVTRFSYDIDPLPQLYRGRILLIGDAAHAKSPTRARGMTSGLEDGLALAQFLASSSDISEALALFEAERKPIVHEYQRTSRKQSLTIGRSQKKGAA